MLAGQSEEQRRRVVFHRPRQQELVQLLGLQRSCWLPSRILQHQTQMIGAGLYAVPIPGQRARIETQVAG